MTPYVLLLILTLLTAGIVFWLVRTDRLPAIALWIVLLGTSTAFLAMLVSRTLSFWYAPLVMVGLSLATAVLLAKRQAEQ